MDNEIIEKYKSEMLEMSRRSAFSETDDGVHTGRLSVFVTTARGLAGIPNAEVSVFKGDINNINVIDSGVTDMSGRTKEFVLPTKSKTLSENSSDDKKPFDTYNIYVKADGYVDVVYLDVPIFEDVTSIQGASMISLEANNDSEKLIVIDSKTDFNL